MTKEQAQRALDDKYGPGVCICVERVLPDGTKRCEIYDLRKGKKPPDPVKSFPSK